MSEWQPIETAPKDQLILAATTFENRAILEICIWSASKKKSGFGDFICQHSGVSNPTHWMPLPPPPKKNPAG